LAVIICYYSIHKHALYTAVVWSPTKNKTTCHFRKFSISYLLYRYPWNSKIWKWQKKISSQYNVVTIDGFFLNRKYHLASNKNFSWKNKPLFKSLIGSLKVYNLCNTQYNYPCIPKSLVIEQWKFTSALKAHCHYQSFPSKTLSKKTWTKCLLSLSKFFLSSL
jgi:hypothetical protein